MPPCFSARGFATFTALVTGMVVTPARRTVCGMLTGSGMHAVWHHSLLRTKERIMVEGFCRPGVEWHAEVGGAAFVGCTDAFLAAVEVGEFALAALRLTCSPSTSAGTLALPQLRGAPARLRRDARLVLACGNCSPQTMDCCCPACPTRSPR